MIDENSNINELRIRNQKLRIPKTEIEKFFSHYTNTKYDSILLAAVLFLVGIGTVMIFSSSSALAFQRYGNSYFFLQKQVIYALIGSIAMIIACNIPITIYKYLAYPSLLISLICLLTLFLPGWGYTAGGATRWLRLWGLSFQPSELARFSLILYLAYSISKKQKKIQEFSIGFLPHAFVVGIFLLLIALQPDFGSVVIMAIMAIMMLFAGGVRFIHLFTCFLAMLPAGYYLVVNAPYRLKRIMTFLNPWEHELDSGYQIIHSLMAFGSGGIFGKGIGRGYQKLFYLPEPHTDFIFSVVGEELGLIGVILIICLYILILWRGYYLAIKTNNLFASYLAIGFTTAISLQVCINLSVTLGLLPTKGLTLPFLSYGGTSLIINMVTIGILMNISSNISIYGNKNGVF